MIADVDNNIKELADTLAGVQDGKLIEAFLRSLLTPAEVADIATRWALVKELNKKTPQRVIAKKLGISLCKITRGSRELKAPDSAFRKMLDILYSSQDKS
ncbi:MAG: trp operon repressor [Spirochaetaceae bacterium]|jgi:TrpR family trp operon transcriptional repressor|nr:trp operon repressor [Spirochaetaceae bacterium]